MKKVIVSMLSLGILSCAMMSWAESARVLFTIHGSNTIGASLAPQCAKAYLESTGVHNVNIYQEENEYLVRGVRGIGLDLHGVAIKIAAHGSSTGFSAMQNYQADLAMSSRPIKNAEAKALASLGNMYSRESEHTIAIDGLAVLVHPDNPVSTLTIDQIAQLFSGEIRNWKLLGGNDAPVHIYARDDSSGTWDTFKKLVLGKPYSLSATALRFESSDVLSDKVSHERNAIGFSGLSSVRNSKLIAVSDDSTIAMKPSRESVATEDYPLSRRLYFYMPQRSPLPWVSDFVDFCLSESGQHIVERVGFVSQNIRSFSNKTAATAPSVYRQLAAKGQRLSVNFRFSEGSPKLDNKAYKDIGRLLDYLSEPKNKGKYVYLVGFSDAGEKQSQDFLLSRFRALAVRGELLREGIAVSKSLGLGSFMPVASNSNDGTKLKNSRVEVWLSDAPI